MISKGCSYTDYDDVVDCGNGDDGGNGEDVFDDEVGNICDNVDVIGDDEEDDGISW